MRPFPTSPRFALILAGLLVIAGLLLLAAPVATPVASAEVLKIGVHPGEPTVCDSVVIGVGGELSSSCYEIIGAEIRGPEPPNPLCMGPVCPAQFEVRITVREPNPDAEIACPAVVEPYRRAFPVGLLPAGAYAVRATEVVVPWRADSIDFPRDSSSVGTLFFVRPSVTCPPGPGCYILGFAPVRPGVPLPGFCTAVVPPGGTACVDLTLHNESPVGGVQTEIVIFDPQPVPAPNRPLVSQAFTLKSVEAVGRAAGFNVDHTVESGVVKVILYSGTGAAIAPGGGPIVRLCYDVGPETVTGSYDLWHLNDVVADPDGNALPWCPTFRETTGRICVVRPGCDANGDGVSNILDVIRIVRCALAGTGTSGGCPDSIAARADCNEDGVVDIRDVICCVRKILVLRAQGPGVPGIPIPATPPLWSENPTALGFVGDVEWMSPVDGRAVLRVRPGPGLGGAEWVLQADPARVRVRDLTLRSGPAGVRLEWAAGGGGSVYAMLVGESGAAIDREVLIDARIERVLGTQGTTQLSLGKLTAASTSGIAVRSILEDPSADVPGGPPVAAPAVYPARPNPFVGESEITFALPAAARVELRVYDVRGRLVRTLVNEARAEGVYHEVWNGRDEEGRSVASGVYLVRFRAAGVTHTERLLRLR